MADRDPSERGIASASSEHHHPGCLNSGCARRPLPLVRHYDALGDYIRRWFGETPLARNLVHNLFLQVLERAKERMFSLLCLKSIMPRQS